MKNLIENTISWGKLGKHPREEYKYEIGNAVLSEKTEILTIDLGLNFVMPWQDRCRMEEALLAEVSGLKGVRFNMKYEDLIQTQEEAVGLYIDNMIGIINGEYAQLTATIESEEFRIDGDLLEIPAMGYMTTDKLNEQISSIFEQMLREDLGYEFNVVFINDNERYERVFNEMEQQEKKAAEEAQKQFEALKAKEEEAAANGSTGSYNGGSGYGGGNGSGGASGSGGGGFNGGNGRWKGRGRGRKKKDVVEGNKIMGAPISGASKPLTEVQVEDGIVIIEGVVFRIDERPIREGTHLVSILVTDSKTTLCCKCFVDDDKYNDIKTHIPAGTAVRMRGDAQWDTYDNMLTVMLKDIEKAERKTREDTNETGKRVELHIHTKMSAMDGLNEVADIVGLATKWGHPAIAITDHGVVQSFPDAAKAAKKCAKDDEPPIKIIYGVEGYLLDDEGLIDDEGNINYKGRNTNHIIILAATQEGLKNIYKIVSYSHLKYFYRRPRIPRSVLAAHREGLIIGSACEAGEVFRAIVEGKSDEELEKIASFYDYLEIQPLINNRFMIENGTVKGEEDLRDFNRKVVALADKLGKPVVATTDSHYTNEEDAIYRNILMAGQGFKDAENGKGLYFRTTDEMLEEFAYLGEDRAHEVVIENTNKIADMIDGSILPVPKGKYPPKIDGAEETLRTSCMARAHEIYGDPLPEIIQKRLDKELDSVISNGYAVMYVSAQLLVKKSLEDGYLVGSRGSVGSSFAATMAGITEVNPLAPHYICPKCKKLIWGDEQEYDCGVDMPAMDCPDCGTRMKQDGYTIPFETFLGFNGDKEPDIDLNFAGEYQPVAHRFVGEIFGEDNVFKAGTVGTVAEKTAIGFVRKYHEEREIPVNKYEVERLAEGCTGVKRTTGQHPGGIIIVPDDHEIYEFCPVQHPANDTTTDIVTTHFDYHKIDENLLKLDILGHDVPSMIRQLQDMTGLDPLTVPLDDKETIKIFNGIEPLKIKDPNYKYTHGSYAIPEFGTSFVRQMLDDTKPSKFADLVRISGFSHGTDVWLNNAQEFIRNGVATMREAISTRDDIMNYLILKGIENGMSFRIMEDVRKNRPLKPEQLEVMTEHGVPEWYIESCKRIQYMFPRAHAVAYVMMSFRMAWYKVNYPREFYATYFTTKVADFNAPVILRGSEAIQERIAEVAAKGRNATAKEKDEVIVLEVAYEMYARGFEFESIVFGKSEGKRFTVDREPGPNEGKVVLPFMALNGVGENAAKAIAGEYEVRPYETVEEIQQRAGVGKSTIEVLREFGVLEGMPETDQLSFF